MCKSFSQNAVPLIYNLSAEHSTPIFRGVFTEGGKVVAPGGTLAAACAGWLAYIAPAQRRIWTSIAVLNVLPLAFTRLVMYSGIQRLLQIEKAKNPEIQASPEEVKGLLGTWVAQNYVRAGLYVVSGVLAWHVGGFV